MEAFNNDGKCIDVVVTGDREVFYNGQKVNGDMYQKFSYDEIRYYDRVCDSLYDLPCFEDGYIVSRYNVFEARAAAHIEEDHTND